MELVLAIVGFGIIGLSVIIGITSGELVIFLTSTISGVLSSLIFFGLSKIISNQERILQMQNSNQDKLNYIHENEVECSNCGRTYGDNRTSCPYCGNRE